MLNRSRWFSLCQCQSVAFVLFSLFIVVVLTYKEPINRDLQKPYNFIYPNGGTERDLEKCASALTTPCNLITNQYFFPFLVTRLCRCPDGECPDSYEPKKSAQNTVQLNNREQLKFCGEIPKCEKDEPAILEIRDGNPSNMTCFCPYKRRRWELQTAEGRQVERYVCKKLLRCKDTCGQLRLDIFATYFHCTCPLGQLCVPKSETPVHIREVLYKGKGLISECKEF